MNITFALTKTCAAYLEIANHIQSLIKQEILKPDEKLPSKRRLASSLNVSTNTIMHAYITLLDSQWIYAVEKKGYFVSQINKVTKPFVETKENKQGFIYDFTTKNNDTTLFPKSLWKRLYKEVLANDDFLSKTPGAGLLSLRNAIAKHLYENRGIHVSAEQIIIGSGVEYLLSLVLPLLPCQICGMENPGYHKIATILENEGIKTKYFPIDKEGICFDNSVDLLYTTPFSQFPLGIKMSLNRKKEMIEFLKKKNSYVIEDDFDAEFKMNAAPVQALYSLNPEHVIFLSSFSRSISSSLRLSYMILPTTIIDTFKKRYATYSNTVPTTEQYVLTKFIEEGHYMVHINKLKRIYTQRRKIIETYFENKDGFKIISKDNYSHLLIKAPSILMTEANQIRVETLADYQIDKKQQDVLLLGYSNLRNQDIIPALELLSSCFKSN